MFRRIKGKLVETAAKKLADSPKVLVKDGYQLAILRPTSTASAQQSITEAEGMLGTSDDGRFNQILQDRLSEGMVFVGLLSTNGRALDPQTLADLGPVKPGDSFVRYGDLLALPEEAIQRPS